MFANSCEIPNAKSLNIVWTIRAYKIQQIYLNISILLVFYNILHADTRAYLSYKMTLKSQNKNQVCNNYTFASLMHNLLC